LSAEVLASSSLFTRTPLPPSRSPHEPWLLIFFSRPAGATSSPAITESLRASVDYPAPSYSLFRSTLSDLYWPSKSYGADFFPRISITSYASQLNLLPLTSPSPGQDPTLSPRLLPLVDSRLYQVGSFLPFPLSNFFPRHYQKELRSGSGPIRSARELTLFPLLNYSAQPDSIDRPVLWRIFSWVAGQKLPPPIFFPLTPPSLETCFAAWFFTTCSQ